MLFQDNNKENSKRIFNLFFSKMSLLILIEFLECTKHLALCTLKHVQHCRIKQVVSTEGECVSESDSCLSFVLEPIIIKTKTQVNNYQLY